jgi:hypothetical protein
MGEGMGEGRGVTRWDEEYVANSMHSETLFMIRSRSISDSA